MGGEMLLDEHEVGCPGNWEEERDCSPEAVWEVFPLCWQLNPSPSGEAPHFLKSPTPPLLGFEGSERCLEGNWRLIQGQRGQATKGVKDRAVLTPGIGELLSWAA